MIKGVHTMFYSSRVEELRKFIKEKLQFTFSDLGDGWLIFDLPEADMACLPAGRAVILQMLKTAACPAHTTFLFIVMR